MKENIQMVIYEPHEDNPSVNIEMRSGIATSKDNVEGKQLILDTWARKAGMKNVGFDLQREKETFMEARKRLMDLAISMSKT